MTESSPSAAPWQTKCSSEAAFPDEERVEPGEVLLFEPDAAEVLLQHLELRARVELLLGLVVPRRDQERVADGQQLRRRAGVAANPAADREGGAERRAQILVGRTGPRAARQHDLPRQQRLVRGDVDGRAARLPGALVVERPERRAEGGGGGVPERPPGRLQRELALGVGRAAVDELGERTRDHRVGGLGERPLDGGRRHLEAGDARRVDAARVRAPAAGRGDEDGQVDGARVGVDGHARRGRLGRHRCAVRELPAPPDPPARAAAEHELGDELRIAGRVGIHHPHGEVDGDGVGPVPLDREGLEVRAGDLEVGARDEQDAELDRRDVGRRLDDHVLGLLAEPGGRLVGPDAHGELRTGLHRQRIGGVEVRRAPQHGVARRGRLGALLLPLVLLRRRGGLEPGAYRRREGRRRGRHRRRRGGLGRPRAAQLAAGDEEPTLDAAPRSSTVAAGLTPSSTASPSGPRSGRSRSSAAIAVELDRPEHERGRTRGGRLAHEQRLHAAQHVLPAREPAGELGRPAVDHDDPVGRDEPHGSVVR